MNQSNISITDQLTTDIRRHLIDDATTELVINEPGIAYVETAGRWTKLPEKDFVKSKINPIIQNLNAQSGGNLTSGSAMLSTTLPTGERIQIMTSPIVKHFAVAIRKPGTIQLTLNDYQNQGAFELSKVGTTLRHADEHLKQKLLQHDIKEFLEHAVKLKKTIIISGGTSTGKTTFFNALAREIPTKERLITIEDSREILLHQHANKLHLLTQRGSKKNTFLEILEACLRLRPDRILAAELRGAEAFTFIRAINTGHPGSMTTIHANSTAAAIEQLKLMIAQAQLGLSADVLERYITNTIDVIVQLVRDDNGQRLVSEISYDNQIYGGQHVN